MSAEGRPRYSALQLLGGSRVYAGVGSMLVNRTYEFLEVTHVTPFLRCKGSIRMDPGERVRTYRYIKFWSFLQFVITEPSRMQSEPTEQSHVSHCQVSMSMNFNMAVSLPGASQG